MITEAVQNVIDKIERGGYDGNDRELILAASCLPLEALETLHESAVARLRDAQQRLQVTTSQLQGLWLRVPISGNDCGIVDGQHRNNTIVTYGVNVHAEGETVIAKRTW